MREFENLVVAWGRVIRKRGDMSFYLVGAGPLEGDYHLLIKQYGVSDTIHILPASPAVTELYQAADVFVLPSVAEGMSNALLEAMASGLPVLASRVPGIAALVQDNVHGYLFNPLKSQEIEQALNRMAEGEALRGEFGRQSQIVAQRFSLDRTLADYLVLYREESPVSAGSVA